MVIPIIFIIFLSSRHDVTACDVAVQMGSNDVNPLSFTVRQGQKICLLEDFGERISVFIQNITRQTTFRLEYYTADYKINLLTPPTTTWSYCRSEGETSCEDEGWCYPGAFNYGKRNRSYELVSHFKCRYEFQSAFNGTCAHYTQTMPSGELFEVWRKVKERRELRVNIGGRDHWQEATLSDSAGFILDLSKFGLKGTTNWILQGWNPTSPSSRLSLLRHSGEFYYVKSTRFGRRKDGEFGDLQISLDKMKQIFTDPQPNDIVCESNDDCSCDCRLRQRKSMMSSFVAHREKYRQPKKVIGPADDEDTIEVVENDVTLQLDASDIDLKLRNERFKRAIKVRHIRPTKVIKNLRRMPRTSPSFRGYDREGACDVRSMDKQWLETHILDGYDDVESLVLKPENIMREGLMSFRSNCSFYDRQIKCFKNVLTPLRARETGACQIEVPSLGKNFTFPLLNRSKKSRRRVCKICREV